MASGKHREGYRRPRTGESRNTRQPLAIDKLSPEARDAIQKFRAEGKTWEEISELSPEFAGKTLAVSTLHRWYDLRVEQVQKEVLGRAQAAREFAASFKDLAFDKLPETTRNALASQVFVLFEEIGNDARARKELGNLLFLLLQQRKLDIAADRVEVEKKKLETLLSKVKGLKEDVAKKKLSAAELQQRLDDIYGITQTEA